MFATALMFFAVSGAIAASQDVGNGFMDHGPVADANYCSGMVCTLDGDGREVVLLWLYEATRTRLAVIDAETGATIEYDLPFDTYDSPFASIFSSGGRYYSYFGDYFVEFDPIAREYSYIKKDHHRAAMSMTEDDQGRIWAATYPKAQVSRFDPVTREFRTYDAIFEHDSLLYPRSMAADDLGWIYVGIQKAAGQIIAMHPETGATRTLVDEAAEPTLRTSGGGRPYDVLRDRNGKVYGRDQKGRWYEFYEGQAKELDAAPKIDLKPMTAGTQLMRHGDLPGGERVTDLDLPNMKLTVTNPATGGVREVSFDIQPGSARSMGMVTGPDGTVCGGTYIPHRFFSYNPKSDSWVRRDCYGQWNAVTVSGDKLYAGHYGSGVLLEWDPAREWVPTKPGDPNSNPRYLDKAVAGPHVGRPAVILAHPDDRHVILGGTPGYGYTGGGLMIYDRQTGNADILTHEQVVPWQSTTALAALPDGNKLVGGTTRVPAMGGENIAKVAELYIFDMANRKVEWRQPLLPGIERYNDMIVNAGGKVIGIADLTRLFVFDPQTRKIIHQQDFRATLGPTGFNQAEIIFVRVPDQRVFMIFRRGIVQLDPESYKLTMVAEKPESIKENFGNGGAYVDGRIYFSVGTRMYSWAVPPIK